MLLRGQKHELQTVETEFQKETINYNSLMTDWRTFIQGSVWHLP